MQIIGRARNRLVNQELFDNARWLTGAIARGLQGRGGEGVAIVLDRFTANSA